MGRDKSELSIRGRRLGELVVGHLLDAGCAPVCTVGGASFVRIDGIEHLVDTRPGAGPLAALADALRWAAPADVVVLPTDLPWLTVGALEPLVGARAGRVTVVARDGRPALPCGRWPAWAVDSVERCLADGRRSLRTVLERVDHDVVEGGPEFDDADTPEDLDRPVP